MDGKRKSRRSVRAAWKQQQVSNLMPGHHALVAPFSPGYELPA
jgi:hypothetical protein